MLDLPPIPAPEITTPVTAECVVHAATTYSLHPDILWAILLVEQGKVGSEVKHDNGAVDIGPAQINTSHLERLGRQGISREMLRNNGCLNITVAAAYVHEVTRGQTFDSADEYLSVIARYHNKREPFRGRYAEKLRQAFAILYNSQTTPKQTETIIEEAETLLDGRN